MGLTFTVGSPADVFVEPHASNVTASLTRCFPSMQTGDRQEPWYSQELAWSGWAQLQELATATLGEDGVPHLLSMEAWKGVYLPIATQTGTLSDIPGDGTPLDVASVPALALELQALGRALGLPTNAPDLQSLAAKYDEDDDLIDEEMDIQTYVQLFLAVIVATDRNVPLWVVK